MQLKIKINPLLIMNKLSIGSNKTYKIAIILKLIFNEIYIYF